MSVKATSTVSIAPERMSVPSRSTGSGCPPSFELTGGLLKVQYQTFVAWKQAVAGVSIPGRAEIRRKPLRDERETGRGRPPPDRSAPLDRASPGGASSPVITEKDRPHTFSDGRDRKSTRLNSSHVKISYAVF